MANAYMSVFAVKSRICPSSKCVYLKISNCWNRQTNVETDKFSGLLKLMATNNNMSDFRDSKSMYVQWLNHNLWSVHCYFNLIKILCWIFPYSKINFSKLCLTPLMICLSGFIIITSVLLIARLFGETAGWRTSIGFSVLGVIMFVAAAAVIFYGECFTLLIMYLCWILIVF